MYILHQTESGYLAREGETRQVTFRFQHVEVRLSPKGLANLRKSVAAMDLNAGQFRPEEKCYELRFSAYPVCLFYDFYEIHEIAEILEEGHAQMALLDLIEGAGIGLSAGTEA